MRAIVLLIAATLTLPALAQTSPDPGACLVQSTSKLDAILNPATGSDEDFFTAEGGVPNIYFMLDNSGSMLRWPFQLCAGNNDCTCEKLNALGYDPATTYDPELKNLNSSGGSEFHTEWFNGSKFYMVPRDGDLVGYGQDVTGGPSGPAGARFATLDTACADAGDAALISKCKQCLQTKGYYLDASSWTDSRMSGNFLNLFSPRYLMLRKVLKQVVRDVQSVRMAVGTFWQARNDGTGTINTNDVSTAASPVPLETFNPSCNLSDPVKNASNFFSNRQSIMSTIDGKLRFGGGTPLARALWMAGYAFQKNGSSTYDSKFAGWTTPIGVTSSTVDAFREKSGQNQQSVCIKCAYSAVILLTDGEPDGDGRAPLGVRSPQIPWTDCGTTGGWPSVSRCSTSDLDEIAKWLRNNDLRPDLDGTQRVNTYTIGFGLEEGAWTKALLAHTASEGGGKAFTAQNASQLKSALLEIFDDINQRSTAFSTSSVASLQTGTSSVAALLPRMAPDASKPWRGELWRFDLYNEFVRDTDRNADGDKDDIFIVDTNDRDVTEDAEGRFVQSGTENDASPRWEARDQLVKRGHATRKIYTVTDSNRDGAFSSTDTRIEFSVANTTKLLPYLGIRGAPACPTSTAIDARGTILTELNLTATDAAAAMGITLGATPTQAQLDDLCARVLITWVRGRDLGDEDGDANRTETRDSVLGDIFHSSPVNVGPPVDKFICDLGLSSQCARTLYAEDLGVPATPLEKQETTNCASQTIEEDAYDRFHREQGRRDRIIVVGANDGMVHAFHDGDAGPEQCVGGRRTFDYVGTSGQELWGFIPPDQLPRLHERLGKHTYAVDGDPMVRDVWVDINDDGRKSHDEFRTVAILPEGRGGTHYFALELRWTSTGNADAPNFLWLYPQPGSAEASTFGKTLYALSPKPPPIGPVLLEQGTANSTAGIERHGEEGPKTVERWIAALSGGWSPGMERGRGVYVVDAWTGSLWWKAEFDPLASGNTNEPKRHLTHSVAGPVALMDFGPALSPRADGYFDTAVFGDLRGQLWVARMHEPGQGTSGRVTNWAVARSFVQAKGASTEANRWPFFFTPSVGIQPDNGAMRVFVGGGNRYALLQKNAGECQYDNPYACAKYGCQTFRVDSTVQRLTDDVTAMGNTWTAGVVTPEFTRDVANQTACGAVGTTSVHATLEQEISACPNVSTPVVTRAFDVACGQRTDGDFQCARTEATVPKLTSIGANPSSSTLTGLGKTRFFGLWAFGGKEDRIFDELQATTGPLSPSAFDARALSDVSGGGLTDVTAMSCDATGKCTGTPALSSSAGWYFDHESLDHKTATGALLASGCVLWSSLYPAPAPTEEPERCTPPAAARTRFHQANYLTGAPNCADAFRDSSSWKRFVDRESMAPPPEPALVVQINPQGVLRTSAMMLPAGGAPQSLRIGQTQDPLQLVYELPVPRALHDCRHTDAGCTAMSP